MTALEFTNRALYLKSAMDIERFRDSPVGTLLPITIVDPRTDERFDHHAFVPRPLPGSFEFSSATWSAVAEAERALGRLDGAGSRLPNPSLLVRPAIRREAVSTSALEGTYAELAEVLEAEVAGGEDLPRHVAEVRNYVKAAERGIELVGELPISVRMINELHGTLMEGIRGDVHPVGTVRDRQNWIGPANCSVADSHFVPPPPGDELVEGLREWESWIHLEDDIPLLVRVAAAHYQFETLHPYRDGNGRLGRLIAVLQLIEGGALTHHLLDVSPYLEARRKPYAELLRGVSETGDFDPWVRFLAEGLRVQAERAGIRVERLLAFKEETLSKLRANRVRGVALEVAENLIGYPVLTAAAAASTYQVSFQAANTAIDRLGRLGVVQELTGRKYGRVFASRRVLQIIEA